MASISKDPGGRRRIIFKGADNKRRAIRLGKVSQETANSVKVRVERLVAAQITGHALDNETALWVAKLDVVLADKLAQVGLIAQREVAVLGPFIANYLKGRTDLKERTIDRLTRSFNLLQEYFGEDKVMRDITAGDGEEYARKLRRKLAENTARKHLSNAKQLFRFAVRKKLITENPLAEMKGLSSLANRKRDHFITRDDAAKVLEACPNGQWRLLFALARFGGLRTPSETLGLTWDDIDWARSRMRVRSPKTEHHSGKDERFVPIFPELREYLDAEFEAAPERAKWVITLGRSKGTDSNLRTTLQKIIQRAGLPVWEKLFHNLRASRATELAADYPAHVAADWLGHSTLVAQKHYWQVTDADFERAVGNPDGARHAARNPAQQVGESGCTRANTQPEIRENAEKCVISAAAENGQHPQQDSNLRPAA